MLRLLLFFALGLVVAWLAGGLRSSQRRLNATLRFIGDAVILTNTRHEITFMNPVAEILTGWTRHEAKGRDFDAVVHLSTDEESAGGTEEPVATTPEDSTTASVARPFVLQSRDGATTPVEGSTAPIRNDAGKIIGTVTVLRDITERRSFEAELRTVEKIRALNKLTAPLAHDFNNWLTVLEGHAELLRGKLANADDPALAASAEAIVEASDAAGRLARQFLALSGGKATVRGRVDINLILDRMREALGSILGDYVVLITELESDLWLAKAAPEQVEQIIINLVANARDAMPMGGVLQIRTANARLPVGDTGERWRPYVMIEVRDDGCGMDEDTERRIFEPFFTTKLRQNGAGLGLSLVYSIIAQSEGRITVTSKPDSGTTFHVYLPRYDEDKESRVPAPVADSRHLAVVPTVLVVESDPSVRRLIASTLRAEDYAVLEAADGLEALEIASRNVNSLDLVVTELSTPFVIGPELITRLALLRPDIKVVYVSSYPKPADWDKNGAEPNREFLFKPFSTGELLARVDFLLSVGSAGD